MDAPIGQVIKCGKGLNEVLEVAKGCQEVRVPVKSGVPARDTRTSQYMCTMLGG
jgi:hypothetical protein